MKLVICINVCDNFTDFEVCGFTKNNVNILVHKIVFSSNKKIKCIRNTYNMAKIVF